MTLIQPLVHVPPGMPAACIGRTWERSRFNWRVSDSGDPAELVGNFLSEYGLGVPSAGRSSDLSVLPGHSWTGICGAALLVSAAGGAAMIGGPAGAPSPAPEVPDVVAVVYEHATVDVPATLTVGGDWTVGPWRPSWTPAEHAA